MPIMKFSSLAVLFAVASLLMPYPTGFGSADAQQAVRPAEMQPRQHVQSRAAPARQGSRQYAGRSFLPGVVVKGSTGGFPVGRFTHGEPYYGGHGVYVRPRRDGFIGGERVRRRPD